MAETTRTLITDDMFAAFEAALDPDVPFAGLRLEVTRAAMEQVVRQWRARWVAEALEEIADVPTWGLGTMTAAKVRTLAAEYRDGQAVTTREEWLAGAEERRAESLREDRPEDVRARLGVPPGWLLRPGGHCATKGGLTTLWAYTPDEEPAGQGRRASDRNVGTVLNPGLAAALCEAFNGRRAPA